MMQEEQGIIRSPLGSRIAIRGANVVGAEASQITTKLGQLQTPHEPKI